MDKKLVCFDVHTVQNNNIKQLNDITYSHFKFCLNSYKKLAVSPSKFRGAKYKIISLLVVASM